MFETHEGPDLGSALVVPICGTTSKIGLVIDPNLPNPCWKFPAGHIELRDIDPKHPDDIKRTASNGGKRECKGETGISLVRLLPLTVLDKRTHLLHCFIGLAEDFSGMVRVGDEGEIPRAFTVEELEALPNFLPSHRPIWQMVKKALLTQ